MGGKAPAAPKAPDPVLTAQAQGAANKDAAALGQKMSMVDQYTPYGNLTYSPIGDDRYRLDVSLSPQQAELERYSTAIDAGMAKTGLDQLGRVSQSLASRPDASSYRPAGQALTWRDPRQAINEDYGYDVSSFGKTPTARDTQYYADAMLSRQQPQLDAARNQMQTQLLQRGIAEGSQAWQRSMDDWNRQQNDLRTAAQLAAGQEQSRMFGDELAGAQFQNQKRNQALNEIYQVMGHEQGIQDRMTADRQRQIQEDAYFRNLPINEINSLLSGVQMQQPQFQNTPVVNVGPAPIQDATYGSYQAQMNAYQQQLQNQQAKRQGMFGLLGSGLGVGGMVLGNYLK